MGAHAPCRGLLGASPASNAGVGDNAVVFALVRGSEHIHDVLEGGKFFRDGLFIGEYFGGVEAVAHGVALAADEALVHVLFGHILGDISAHVLGVVGAVEFDKTFAPHFGKSVDVDEGKVTDEMEVNGSARLELDDADVADMTEAKGEAFHEAVEVSPCAV